MLETCKGLINVLKNRRIVRQVGHLLNLSKMHGQQHIKITLENFTKNRRDIATDQSISNDEHTFASARMGVCILLLRMCRMKISLFWACSVPTTLRTQTQILTIKSYFDHFNSSHQKYQYVAPDTTTIFPQHPNNGNTAEHSRNYASALTLLLGFIDVRTRRNAIVMPCAHFLTCFQSHYLILYIN